MYECFTDRARKVMQLANQEAQRLNHDYIGTEHILLGLVKEGSGVAFNVLKNLDVDLHRIRVEVERIVEYVPGEAQVVAGRLPRTPRAKKVIDYSVEEARALNHNYIGTEHLLLGLLREEEGVAAQVLIHFGLDSATIREEILSLLGPTIHVEVEGFDWGIPKSLASENVEVYTVSDLTPFELSSLLERHDNERMTLTDEQIELINDRIRNLDELKKAVVRDQDFVQARRYQGEATALAILLKLYEGIP